MTFQTKLVYIILLTIARHLADKEYPLRIEIEAIINAVKITEFETKKVV